MELKWSQRGLQMEVEMEAKLVGRARNHTHKMRWKQEGPSGTHSERNGTENHTKWWPHDAQMVPKLCLNLLRIGTKMDPKSSPRGVDERVASLEANSHFLCARKGVLGVLFWGPKIMKNSLQK